LIRKVKTQPPVDLILETSSALFLCGAAFAVICLIMQGAKSPAIGMVSPRALIVATALPAAASLLLLIVAIMAPGIYAVQRLAFPLNITLPLIHGSMIYMLAELTRGSFGVELPPPDLQPALIWDNIGFLAISVMFQVILLTGLAAIRGGSSPPAATAGPE